MKTTTALLAALALSSVSMAAGQIVITEWMYSGSDGEFIELTNIGDMAVDLTGWSYDDDSQTPGVLDLSAAGSVAAGQSIILSEESVAFFRAQWGLDNSVVVIGDYTNNLGRNDEINIFDNNGLLVDRLTYGDETVGSIRTQNISGWTTVENLGTNNAAAWFFSSVGDLQGSYLSAGGDLGNPGSYIVPAPGAAALLGLGALVTGRRRR
jgi:MYXO-CTERM domain-containing protein